MTQRWIRAVPVALLTLAVSATAQADYLVLQDGRAMKVRTYRFENGEVVVNLEGGGYMRFPEVMVRYAAPDEEVESSPVTRTANTLTDIQGRDGTPGWQGIADPGFVEAIERMSIRYALDPALVAAVIRVESDYRPHAVSPRGAKGLMQLMPATAAEHGLRDPFDAEANIEAGSAHLRKLLSRYGGDLRLALAAYNAGQGAVAKAGGVPDFPETQSYVQRVLTIAGQL